MARPLRLEFAGGRFHVTLRGNDRQVIFRQDADRYRFLKLLSELPERFGTRIHAYVLMNNHVHLLLETPEPNLSRTMQWLGVSYTMWYNVRHRRSGHLFQGRFKAFVVEDLHGWQEVARYVHLNPVRVGRLGLGKSDRSASRVGMGPAPSAPLVGERLGVLRQYPWSSYRGYAGYQEPLDWVWPDPLSSVCGGRSTQARRLAVRQYTEEPVRQGLMERPADRLVGGLALGTPEFGRHIVSLSRGNSRNRQRVLSEVNGAVPWERIVLAVERVKGEKWRQFRDRYGDWGRDAALWLGRRSGRLKLAELGRLAGGIGEQVVSRAVRAFHIKHAQDASLQQTITRIEKEIAKT